MTNQPTAEKAEPPVVKTGDAKMKAEVVVHQEKEVMSSLLDLAIKEKVPVETLERLVVMQKEMKADLAKEAFNADMAKFQSECPTIGKEKTVEIKGVTVYKYTPIETIASEIKEPLKKYGFSYSFKVETIENDGGVNVTCIARHSIGHAETSSFKVPLGTQTAVMSDTQRVAAATTFAKRYALLNVFGIMTGGDDRDENLQDPKQFQKDTLKEAEARLAKAKSVSDLLEAWHDLPAPSKKEPKIVELKNKIKAMMDNDKARNEDLEGPVDGKSEKKKEELAEKFEKQNGESTVPTSTGGNGDLSPSVSVESELVGECTSCAELIDPDNMTGVFKGKRSDGSKFYLCPKCSMAEKQEATRGVVTKR